MSKTRQSYSNGYLPYHCLFYYLVRVRDVTCARFRLNEHGTPRFNASIEITQN